MASSSEPARTCGTASPRASAISPASRPINTAARQCLATESRKPLKSAPLPSPPAIRITGRATPSSATFVAATDLDAWRDASLPDSLLNQLDDAFVRVRGAGLKLVLRVSYNDPAAPGSDPRDASLVRIHEHIARLHAAAHIHVAREDLPADLEREMRLIAAAHRARVRIRLRAVRGAEQESQDT